MRNKADGWLDHREAVLRYGKATDSNDWTGTEHVAFSPSVLTHDLARVEEISTEDALRAYEDAVRPGIEQQPVEPVSDIVCTICNSPSTRIIDGIHYCSQHGAPKPIPEKIRALMTKHCGAPDIDEDAIKKGAAEIGREILRAATEAQYEPERQKRERWNRWWAGHRDSVLAGEIEFAVEFLGEEKHWPTLDELRSHYPGAHELMVNLPSLGLPARIIFRDTGNRKPMPSRRPKALNLPPTSRARNSEIDELIRAYARSQDGKRVINDKLVEHVQAQLPTAGRDRIRQRRVILLGNPTMGRTPVHVSRATNARE